MRVAKMVVPPAAVTAGRAVMTGDFTTEAVADAVRGVNQDVGMDTGEMTSDEFALKVAVKLIEKAVADDRVVGTGEDAWRGVRQEW